jgi:hypothetical protein
MLAKISFSLAGLLMVFIISYCALENYLLSKLEFVKLKKLRQAWEFWADAGSWAVLVLLIGALLSYMWGI